MTACPTVGRSLKVRMLKWALSGGAFAVVVATASSCARFHPSMLNLTSTLGGASDEPPAQPVRIAQTNSDAEEAGAEHEGAIAFAGPTGAVQAGRPSTYGVDTALAPEPPPQINVFGEFDGRERGPVRTVREAGFQQHTFLDEGYDADVAVDPTGKWLAFSSTRHSDNAEIYLQRVDGTAVVQLTSDAADDANPAFSPDGRMIAFASTRAGNWDIYAMDKDGRNVTQVTSGPMQDLHPSFSPDGARLVYCSTGGRSGQWEIWTVDLRTLEKRMVGFGLFPNWSPDKSVDRIAYQRARQRGGRWFSLWTMDLIDGEGRRNTEIAVSTNAALVAPAWSPDGRRIAFATIAEPARSADGKPLGQQDVWTVNADGTNRQRLTDGNGVNLTPFWAADNRVYFVSDRGGAEAIWSVKAHAAAMPAVAQKDEKHDDAAQKDPFASTDAQEMSH